MLKIIKTKAQGAFEYILLLGGVLLIVVVSIIILRGSVLNQANKQIVGNTNAWQNTVCIPTYLGDSAAVGVWHFENDAQDSSGKGNHGSTYGFTVSPYATGKKGQALNLDGSGYVEIPNSPSLRLKNALTFEAWIKPTDWTNEPILAMEAGSGIAYGMNIGYNSWTLNVYLDTDGVGPWELAMTGTSIPSGTWAHVAATWNGTTVKSYVNGNAVTNAAFAGPIATVTTNLDIGAGAGSSTLFNGMIDDAIIYNRALSQQEIQKDMNCMG